MNWNLVYDKIIKKAQEEKRSRSNANYDMHHILPKSLGGSEEKNNLVLLTYREHYFCHHLLTKMYPGSKMACALWFMSHTKYKVFIKNIKEYERIRTYYIQNSEYLHNEHWKGNKNPQYGIRRTGEEKKKFRELFGFKIFCVETGEHFKSQKEAAEKYNLCRSGVLRNLNGEASQVGGFHFQYIDKNRRYKRKAWDEKTKKNFNLKQGIKLMCIETGEFFNSRTEAAKKLSLSYKDIRYNRNKKYHFKEIKNDTNNS